MAYAFAEIAFTPSVRQQQDANGSGAYAGFLLDARSGGDTDWPDGAERRIRISDAFDWNCPQHIPRRLTKLKFGNELAAIAQNITAFGDAGIALEHVSFRHKCRYAPTRFKEFFDATCEFLTQYLHEELHRLPDRQTLRQEVLNICQCG